MRKAVLGTIAALAAAAGSAGLLAYRVSQETGKGVVDSIKEAPAEGVRYWEELRARGAEAYEAGRQAAREKQSEIERELDD